MMSSNNSKVSGGGWSREIKAVFLNMCMDCLIEFTIWKVVELSRPVEISSMKSTFTGPTSSSPKTGKIQLHYQREVY